MNANWTLGRMLPWLVTAGLGVLLLSCGGGGGAGRDPILGAGGIAALSPTVTAVAPVNNATGVPVNSIVIAAFSADMSAASINATTFTVACSGVAVSGSVSYNGANRAAIFAPAGSLPASATCTATVTTGAMNTAGVPLAANYAWSFATGASQDTTRPRIISTVPASTNPGPTTGVPANTAITALFSEDMAPGTITSASFMVTCPAPCVAPAGTVSYAVGSRTGVFTPAAVLASGTTYTVTITTAVTDLAGNALSGNLAPLPGASNYVWSFTTTGPSAPANLAVLSTSPSAGATGLCPNASVNATFSVPSGLRMDPVTVTAATFSVTGPAPATTPIAAASVVLDAASGRIATFTPLGVLSAGALYTVTIKGGASGVRDLAIPANMLASDFVWTFTTGNCTVPVGPPTIPLGSAAPFGTFGGSAGTTNSGLLTVINGDVGTTAVSTAVTGFHDAGPGCIYTETPLNVGTVNGRIYTAPPSPTPACPTEGTAATFLIASQARADALVAYNTLAGLPPGLDPGSGNLANLVLAPGTYTAAAGSFLIRGGNLTLDGQGNANAVWVFQMATSLTVGGPGAAFPQSVTLINGAQAKNVYWQVGSAATINAGGGGTMAGTIIAQAGATFSTAGNTTISVLNGRVLSLGASVTLVNTVINVPAP